MDQIIDGIKTSEFKGKKEHWNTRIKNLGNNVKYNRSSKPGSEWFDCVNVGISLLCGQKSYKFMVISIIDHHIGMEIDGVWYDEYWEIKLGARIQ